MSVVSFPSTFFSGNRLKLRESFNGTAPIVLTANGILQRTSDTDFPFAQDSSFWYLTGISLPDVVLVLDKDKEYLVLGQKHQSRTAIDSPISESDLTSLSGIKTIFSHKDGWKILQNRLKKVKHVATLSPPAAYIDFFGFYTNPARSALIHRLKEANGELTLLDLREHLMRLRIVKQPMELEAIQSAIDITIASVKEAFLPRQLTKYQFEYEIEADIRRGFRKRGADGDAFSPIIAGGKNATIFHKNDNNDVLNKKELLMVDVGAEVNHYAADIARTINFQRPSTRQLRVFNAVAEAQVYAISLLKPGVILKDYEQLIEQFVGEKLRELGLIKSISKETVRKYYPHLASHFVGLDVHDIGDTSKPLEEGMVLAVEPGIYIENEKIGVRIEDDIVITPTGNTILTSNLPRNLR